MKLNRESLQEFCPRTYCVRIVRVPDRCVIPRGTDPTNPEWEPTRRYPAL